ncbi:hypothetical protein BG004_002014 [Podila humilis]|nr:hypothetical protein BG004_002014 [Podila humilis]
MIPPHTSLQPGTPDAHALSPNNFLASGNHPHSHPYQQQYFQLQRSLTAPSAGLGMEGVGSQDVMVHTEYHSSSAASFNSIASAISAPTSPPHTQFPTLPSIPHQQQSLSWSHRPTPNRTSSAPYRISRPGSDMSKSTGASGHSQTTSFSSPSSSSAPRSRTRTSSVTSSTSNASFGPVSSLSSAFSSTRLSYAETPSPSSTTTGTSSTSSSMNVGTQPYQSTTPQAYPRRQDYMNMSPQSALSGPSAFQQRDGRISCPSSAETASFSMNTETADANPTGSKLLSSRNFPCSVHGCKKSYTQLHNLKSHERTGHTPVQKLKPFLCIISGCTKAFSQRKSLAHHIKISHQEFKFKPFKCGQADCSKAYTQLHNLRTHEKTVHRLDLSKKRIRLPDGPREAGSLLAIPMTLDHQQQQQQQQQHHRASPSQPQPQIGMGFGAPPPPHIMEGQYKLFTQLPQHEGPHQQGGIIGADSTTRFMQEDRHFQGDDGSGSSSSRHGQAQGGQDNVDGDDDDGQRKENGVKQGAEEEDVGHNHGDRELDRAVNPFS